MHRFLISRSPSLVFKNWRALRFENAHTHMGQRKTQQVKEEPSCNFVFFGVGGVAVKRIEAPVCMHVSMCHVSCHLLNLAPANLISCMIILHLGSQAISPNSKKMKWNEGTTASWQSNDHPRFFLEPWPPPPPPLPSPHLNHHFFIFPSHFKTTYWSLSLFSLIKQSQKNGGEESKALVWCSSRGNEIWWRHPNFV